MQLLQQQVAVDTATSQNPQEHQAEVEELLRRLEEKHAKVEELYVSLQDAKKKYSKIGQSGTALDIALSGCKCYELDCREDHLKGCDAADKPLPWNGWTRTQAYYLPKTRDEVSDLGSEIQSRLRKEPKQYANGTTSPCNPFEYTVVDDSDGMTGGAGLWYL